MKIISIGLANPLRGDIAKFNESFALACMAEGHDAEIVSFSFLYPGFLFPGKSQFSNDPPPKGIIINTWLHPLNPFNWIIVARKIIHLNPEKTYLLFFSSRNGCSTLYYCYSERGDSDRLSIRLPDAGNLYQGIRRDCSG